MQRAIEIFAILNFAVIGLSHLFRPRVWVDFFVMLRQRGEAGVFVIVLLNLLLGSIIVAGHNVWQGIPMVLTIVGWASLLKAAVYSVFPALVLRKLEGLTHERAYMIAISGTAFILVAGLLAFHVWGSR